MTRVWDVETWVGASKDDQTRAVKQFVRLAEEPGPNELAELRSQAVGLYRRTYSEWGLTQGQTVRVAEASGPRPAPAP